MNNPERMRPTPASNIEVVQRANKIVEDAVDVARKDPDKRIARNATIFKMGVFKVV